MYAAVAEKARVATPPVLPGDDMAGLRSVFGHFDDDHSGTVSYSELVEKGLIYDDRSGRQFLSEFDRDGNGMLDELEFCQMMCPFGFRAHAGVKTASLPNGDRVVFDERLGFWRLDVVE